MSDAPSGKSPRRVKVKIELPSNLVATYANLAVITHSPSEIIIDYAQALPQQPKARVQARVIMTALNAKQLYRALGDNIAKYETQFGEIQLPKQGPSLAQQFFGPPPPDPQGEK